MAETFDMGVSETHSFLEYSKRRVCSEVSCPNCTRANFFVNYCSNPEKAKCEGYLDRSLPVLSKMSHPSKCFLGLAPIEQCQPKCTDEGEAIFKRELSNSSDSFIMQDSIFD